MIIHCFAKLIIMEGRRLPKVILHLDLVYNLPTYLLKKSWMKNRLFPPFKSHQSHPNATYWRHQSYI